ncbi:MAG: glycoside hydrolase family 32 protein [Christiangramia sp.]|uniref:glycoside hydrolase family 32 protein n=1 Tax=Christiangramia sp. TaxID=1931228 RepID=UPI003242EA47
MKKFALVSISLMAFLTFSCKNDQKNSSENDHLQSTSDPAEMFRPSFHFTPEEHWMNDPNGMFYLDGTYHLYYQYYPEGNVWGPMHWGHATTKDLINWEHQDIALKPDEKGYIFSGSAVVDLENTSGFGNDSIPPVIAMFTYHDPESEKAGDIDYQSQAIAYSNDGGYTWTKYQDNPVIPNPGLKDFRDPKMLRDTINDQWLMVLSANDRSFFYASENLKDWKKISEFGLNTGAHNGVWECPDFFPMKVEGSDEIKWVLIQSLNPGGYNGGSGTQYFVGDFDGKQFTPEKNMQNLEEKHPFWIDFGRDNYAGVTWSNLPGNRVLFMGWMSNWLYAQEVPTEKWRSSMTIPRDLILKKEDSVYQIYSEPFREFKNYRKQISVKNSGESNFVVSADTGDFLQNQFTFELPLKDKKKINFALTSKSGDTLQFGLDIPSKQFFVDRSKSGMVDFKDNFSGERSTAPRLIDSETLKVNFITDRTSIEIFYDNGRTVMTEIFFPEKSYDSFAILEEGLKPQNLKVYDVRMKPSKKEPQ